MKINNKTPPPSHQWVETEDGSYTLFSEAFQEACHSSSGALAETHLHYLKGCQVEEKLKVHKDIAILEVGFGLGVGFLATFEALRNLEGKWTFISLEIDEKLLEWFRLENQEHEFLKNLIWKKDAGLNFLEAQSDSCHLTILCGDARKTLPEFLEKNPHQWSAIYQDAFSPRRNPILWTVEWFKTLKEYAKLDVILSTYSASSSIRKSLIEAGWKLHKGDKFGPKRTSTRATLTGISDPEILLHLERSPVSALRDDNVDSFVKK